MRAKAEKVVLVVQGRLPPLLLVVSIFILCIELYDKVYVYLHGA
jgi:hypothetical protein